MAALPSWLHCTGAIYMFCRIKGGPILYLGTAEQHPVPEGEIHYEPVFNDLGGPRTKFDSEFQGEEEVVAIDLNRYNEAVFSILTSPPFYDGVTGWQSRLARGSFLIQQGNAYEFWLQYSFYGTADATADLPAGTYYPACATIGKSDPKQGTKTKTRRLIVEPHNWYDPTDGSFMLYSHDPSFFTGLPSPLG